MPATISPAPSHATSDAIAVNCERALRRLDALIEERDDVVLEHVRQFVSRARALAVTQAPLPSPHSA